MTSTTLSSLVYKLEVRANKALLNVPFVASMPMAFVFEAKAAGFIAGSIPINGMS